MKDIMSIKKRLEQKSAINGKAGVAIMSDMLNDEKIRNLVIKHYNSITCENEMKPEIILGDVPVFSVDTEGSICCLLYTSPSPRDGLLSRMPSSA